MTKKMKEKAIKKYESMCKLWVDMAIDGVSTVKEAVERLLREEKELQDFIFHGFHFDMVSEKDMDDVIDYIVSDNNARKIQEDRLYANYEIAVKNYNEREERRNRKNRAV